MPLGMIAVIPLVGRLYPTAGPRRLIAAGMLGATVTSLLFLPVDLQTSLGWIGGIMFLRGIAFGLCIIPVQASTYAAIAPKDMGRASSLFSTGRQVATAVSIAALVTVLTSRAQTHVAAAMRAAAPAARAAAVQHGTLLAFHDAFAVSALIALAGIGFALLIRDEDAAATMRVHPHATREAEPAPVLGEAFVLQD
jgi:MFS family permease